MSEQTQAVSAWRTPMLIIAAGCFIALIGFGIRSIFGLFLDPMTATQGWSRETFGLALAIQNLLWGIGTPVAGAIADRWGPTRVLVLGAVIYGVGIYGMATSETGLMLHLTGGFLVGLGVAFTSFSIAIAAMAKVVRPERRSLAMGLGTAAGSAGQVFFSPAAQGFIEAYGWETTLLFMAASALAIIPLAFILTAPDKVAGDGESAEREQTIREAVREAMSHNGYLLLTAGFFVCGFHVAFIAVHFPAYVKDLGLPSYVGAVALSLIGLFNIAGSFASGAFGQRFSKKMGLSWIYGLRALVILALLMTPKSEWTIYLFAGAMGFLWLSTVPLTSGIVGQVFGVRYLTTLFGFVFLSHQLGSFIGVWLGGYLYDTTGSYDGVWWAGVGFGLAAMALHIAIDERPVARLSAGRGRFPTGSYAQDRAWEPN